MLKLGRKPAQFDPNVPKLMSLALDASVVPSVSSDYTKVKFWPMLLNDQLGDCTIAGVGHVIEYWNTVGHMSLPTMTNSEALSYYETIGGYDPKDPSTDQGCVELDVLKYFEKHGIMAASQLIKLTKFLSVPATNLTQIKSAVYHLGNCYFGYDLPSNALQTTLWDIDPNATIEGGHCINCVGYDDSKSLLYVVSWGTVVPVTYDFHKKYCEEAWALYSADWVARS